MQYQLYPSLLILFAIIAGCNTPPQQEEAKVVALDTLSPNSTTTVQAETASRSMPPDTIVLPDHWPIDQGIVFESKYVSELCTNKWGCLYPVLYPLGWSEDGKFAYLLAPPNEAVNDYRLTFVIQDMTTNRLLVEQLFKASNAPDFREDHNYDFSNVWRTQQPQWEQLLNDHDIQKQVGTGFVKDHQYASNDTTFYVNITNEAAFDEMWGQSFLKRLTMEWVSKAEKKRIATHSFGRYDHVLAAQVIGFFRSPTDTHIAVLIGLEKRGYEGPPNVLALYLAGGAVE
ncbi:MAG: hypothetical protein R2795_26735 [Saprospiraceae bacterium]